MFSRKKKEPLLKHRKKNQIENEMILKSIFNICRAGNNKRIEKAKKGDKSLLPLTKNLSKYFFNK